VYVTEVVAENFQMLESRAAREGGNANGGYNQSQQQAPSYSKNNGNPFGNSNPMDIQDSDLPF
jgi:single-stranded DNA-binding protein